MFRHVNMAIITAILLITALYILSWMRVDNEERAARKHRMRTSEQRVMNNDEFEPTEKDFQRSSEHDEEIKKLITAPSTGKQHLKQNDIKDFSQAGQSKFIDECFEGMRNGFFVESGAADGERLSNTLFFELERNWTGLLIEPNPKFFKNIKSLNRHSYAINTCLSLTRYPSVARFNFRGYSGGIVRNSELKETVRVKCYPLYDILRTIGHLHINYLSLDVEGYEVEVLKTIPFDKVTIDMMTVEYYSSGSKTPRHVTLTRLKEFVLGTGLYDQIGLLSVNKSVFEGKEMQDAVPLGLDVVFKRKNFVLQ